MELASCPTSVSVSRAGKDYSASLASAKSVSMEFVSRLRPVTVFTVMRVFTVISLSQFHLVIGATLTGLIIVSAMRGGRDAFVTDPSVSQTVALMATVLSRRSANVISGGSPPDWTSRVI